MTKLRWRWLKKSPDTDEEPREIATCIRSTSNMCVEKIIHGEAVPDATFGGKSTGTLLEAAMSDRCWLCWIF
jgi:hypothetical protein